MFCHSGGCGMTRRIMQSATRCTAVVHMMLVIRVYDEAGNVIEMHEHAGAFKAAVTSMNDFFHQIGRAMESWGLVESSLCTLFVRVTKMHPPMGRKIFYASAGFRARA